MIGLVAIVLVACVVFALIQRNDNHSHDHTHSHEEVNTSNSIANNKDFTNYSTVELQINNHKISESHITIKKGTTVTWLNNDSDEHSVMKDHAHSDKAHSATTLDNVNPRIFSSPSLNKGDTYSFTFNDVGVVEYHCSTHTNERGKITVVE